MWGGVAGYYWVTRKGTSTLEIMEYDGEGYFYACGSDRMWEVDEIEVLQWVKGQFATAKTLRGE